MSNITKIQVPDLGGADQADVIEVLVSVGDKIEAEQALITLEGEKASMDVPSTEAGTVTAVLVSVGDKVSTGTAIVDLDTGSEASEGKPSEESTEKDSEAAQSSEEAESEEKDTKKTTESGSEAKSKQVQDIVVPDIGADQADVIEVHVAVGDEIEAEQSLITLEGEKASMDVPSSHAGKVTALSVKVGDKVAQGSVLGQIEVVGEGGASSEASGAKDEPSSQNQKAGQETPSKSPAPRAAPQASAQANLSFSGVHATPSLRKRARELGVDLTQVTATGYQGRILNQDVQDFIRAVVSEPGAGAKANAPAPVDFSQFGEIEKKPFNKIKAMTGKHMSYCWATIPHVTQFGEADITEMEALRQQHKDQAKAEGVRLTPLAFITQILAKTLQEFPNFNASLDPSGGGIILKKYCHIGIAVETPAGLVVPVLRDVIGKSIMTLASEMGALSEKARDEKLGMGDMKGGCMTISSLGGIGGTAFTPIVNAPEVAILGVSKSYHKPVYRDGKFYPRLMLPLSLSYDHRVIDGAEGARFLTRFAELLEDVNNLSLS